MNRPIRKVAVVAAVMFFALLVNASWLEVGRATTLNHDTRNRRVTDAEYARNRGAILVGTDAIAQSVPQSGRFAFARRYSQPALYAHATGYYAYDFGSAGIELNYSKQLAGTSDDQFFNRLVDRLTGKAPAGGSTLTTLDAAAQKAAYDGLAGRKGAVVALDWTTGAVLTYVSLPTFDPNALSSTNLATSQKAWKDLNADKNRPLANRASKEIYPPGSTFKLVTAAAALENGSAPGSLFKAPESLRLPQSNVTLTNQINCGGAEVTLEQALKVSCNTAFANIGMDLGADKLNAQAEKFGFNKTVPTDVPWATSNFPTTLDTPQTAMSAIGQYEVAATPLQMAMVIGAIANGGQVMQPYMVKEVRDADLSVISTHRPVKLDKAMSTDNARLLADMLVVVVDDGTGKPAKVDGTRVGGKTGTAQSDPNRPPYAWFVAFSENPNVAVAVFIEDADIDRSEIAGGRLGGPIAKAVIEALK
ncbi:peptidoglycan D,D-transpeptidase FtsI family protein [Propionibacteriaceae bacterium G57]|uniref:peptidoglycan D,D-transpeptidase FtsI family protein n=1 Tax=Aestuariimicrobium sp. G57 TaxID=3418485 RepID=UPI003DA70F28